MSDIERLRKIAASRVGKTEYPTNSNNIDCNTWYYGHEVYDGLNGKKYPYCVVEIQYIFHLAGLDNLVARSASSTYMYNYFKSQGRIYSTPQAGDWVFYNFNKNPNPGECTHTGWVYDVNSDGSIQSYEGNTSFSDTGLQSNGGAITVKRRSSHIVGFGRPIYPNIEENKPKKNYIYGIDLSSNQGDIDFNKLKNSNLKFAILRSTVRGNGTDKRFIEYYNGCKKIGLNIDVYKFSYALNENDAFSEAAYVIQLLLKNNIKGITVWYDLEWNEQSRLGKEKIAKIADVFCNALLKNGFKVGIYCNLNWYRNFIDESIKSKYNFWIARYGKNTGRLDETYIPNVGEMIWQYTSMGRIEGINTSVDLDVRYVENDDIKPTPIPPSPTPVPVPTPPTPTNKTITVNNVVIANKLNIRKGNGTNYPIIGYLSKGMIVNILGHYNGWYYLNINGWVSDKYIKVNKALCASGTPIRKDGNSNSEILTTSSNDKVQVLNQQGDWYFVHKDITGGYTGWCLGSTLTPIDN